MAVDDGYYRSFWTMQEEDAYVVCKAIYVLCLAYFEVFAHEVVDIGILEINLWDQTLVQAGDGSWHWELLQASFFL